jgi:hypothetical protein
MTKHPPKGFVILWTGKFHGRNYEVSEVGERLAVLIPRFEVATLKVNLPHVNIFSGLLTITRT